MKTIDSFADRFDCARYDWCGTPFAPGLKCVQALSTSGRTASGAGFRRSDALVRCKGELAEITALETNSTLSCVAYLKDSSWTGIAAAESSQEAQRRALYEALERAATDLWWQGLSPAIELNLNQKINHPLSSEIIRLRGSGNCKRSTKILLLTTFEFLCITVAVSASLDGSRVIFGFGAHTSLAQSARSALLEMALMELNLFDVVPGTSQNQHLKKLTQSFVENLKNLIVTPAKSIQLSCIYPDEATPSVEQKLADAGARVEYFDLTVDQSHPVFIAKLANIGFLGEPSPHVQRPLI